MIPLRCTDGYEETFQTIVALFYFETFIFMFYISENHVLHRLNLSFTIVKFKFNLCKTLE